MTDQEKQILYTIRWNVRNKWGDPSSQSEVVELLGELIGDGIQPSKEPMEPSASSQKLLWVPFAKTNFPKSRTRGTYANGYPKGAIVHFTSGRRTGVDEGIAEQVRNGYTYFVISADGEIAQNFPLDSWGYHAGDSSYSGLNGTVSDELVGIEVQCGGKLEPNGKTWFGTTPSSIRNIPHKVANQEAGNYETYTPEQEASLERLIRWLKSNNPTAFDFKFVLGHDEVSPGRKNDPGGSLSMTMPDFRKKLIGSSQ